MKTCTALTLSLISAALLAQAAPAPAQSSGPVRVTIKDGKIVASEPTQPVDPTPRISPQHQGVGFNFGLSIDGKRLCCSPQGSIWSTYRIDGQMLMPGQGPVNNGAFGGFVAGMNAPRALPPGPFNKRRIGFEWTWSYNKLLFTQTVEVISSKLPKGSKEKMRKLDTCRISYTVENKDNKPHKIEHRTSIDMLINNNDGALYSSPVTHKGKVLNGVVLAAKQMPPYILCMENADANNPGFHGVMTFKQSKGEGPNKVVLSNLGAVSGGFNQWEVAAQPAGDSACAIYWDARDVRPGEKRVMVWSYGGGIASDADNEGKVTLGLGGSFEPNKLFTITALVEDPAPNQALTLELPEGLRLVDGREIQPVPAPGPEGSSVVMWRARVLRTGEYPIRVRSSNGTTQIKNVLIAPAGAN